MFKRIVGMASDLKITLKLENIAKHPDIFLLAETLSVQIEEIFSYELD